MVPEQGEFILTRLQNNIDKLHYILDNTSHTKSKQGNMAGNTLGHNEPLKILLNWPWSKMLPAKATHFDLA